MEAIMSELQQAYIKAFTASERASVPAAQRKLFREIAQHIWSSCGDLEQAKRLRDLREVSK